MPVVKQALTINAPRERVWAVLADIGSVSQWNPVVTHSAETSGTESPAGVGAARHCELPGSMGAIDEVVTDWNELEAMEFDIRGARMMREMRGRFELSAVPGGTQVEMSSDFRMGLGPLGALMAAIMGKRMLASNMKRALEGLRSYVEADVSGSDGQSAAVPGDSTT
jgi:carbon monoxide dehydrogenase subunit G